MIQLIKAIYYESKYQKLWKALQKLQLRIDFIHCFMYFSVISSTARYIERLPWITEAKLAVIQNAVSQHNGRIYYQPVSHNF